ncbi:MAG: hypothetical protein JWO82_2199 [Akkermansiaceae bacterium]|nr:hypothetical protein [Akkermansiaceae bacterium]
MRKKVWGFWRLAAIWWLVLDWPSLLVWIPGLRMVIFLPFLVWVNVPALGLHLAETVGPPHYEVEEFGAQPGTALGWGLIVIFWMLATALLAGTNLWVLRLVRSSREPAG